MTNRHSSPSGWSPTPFCGITQELVIPVVASKHWSLVLSALADMEAVGRLQMWSSVVLFRVVAASRFRS